MISRSRAATSLFAAAVLTLMPRGSRADIPMQVKVYGFLNAEVERAWATGGATPYTARFRVSDGNSRIGFSGTIDLGEETQALWQIEGGLNDFEQGGVNDKGVSSVLESRNTFVGIEDQRFGRLMVGYVDSAYRSLVGSGGELGGNLGLTSLGLDLWNNTSAQVTGNPDSIFSRGETRMKNSVHYLSPDWIVRVGASYSFDEAMAGGQSHDRFSLAARLKWKEFQLGAGFDHQNNTGADSDALEQGFGLSTTAVPGAVTYYTKLVASYTAPTGTYFGAGWERGSYGYSMFVPASSSNPYTSLVTGNMSQDGAIVSVAQPIGSAAVMVSFGKLWPLHNAIYFAGGQFEATQLSLGVKYAFNDTFMSYLYYTAISNKAEQNANLGQSPIYSNNVGTSSAYLSPGDSPHATGLGLIARF